MVVPIFLDEMVPLRTFLSSYLAFPVFQKYILLLDLILATLIVFYMESLDLELSV